jgi:outer membrane biosynthesis protein TonB
LIALRDNSQNRGIASLAIAAAVVLHVWLIWLLFQQQVEIVRRPPPEVILLQPPVSPAHPKPVVPPKKILLPKPVVVQKPVVTKRIIVKMARRGFAKPHAAPRPLHFAVTAPLAGLGLDIGTPAGGNGQPGEIDTFDDAVKQRIAAAKTYPPGLKGFWNECVVSYRVTVDRGGQLLDYKIYGCGNAFLDSAAAAAVLSAQPYPVPPNFGGTRYDVFGSLIFKSKGAQP